MYVKPINSFTQKLSLKKVVVKFVDTYQSLENFKNVVTMGQALTSCCSSTQAYENEDSNQGSYQKVSVIGSDDQFPELTLTKDPLWKEKINTNSQTIVLDVNPKSSEEEIAAGRMKILTNLATEA